MMKNIIALYIVSCLIFILSACNAENIHNSSADNNSTSINNKMGSSEEEKR